MAKMHDADVLRNYEYEVQISGVSGINFENPLGFSSVSGLMDESEVIEYREGTNPAFPAKMPGQVSVGDVTFERGVAKNFDAKALSEWRSAIKSIMETDSTTTDGLRATITIRVKDEGGGSTVFRLKNAWPSSLEIGDLSADSSDVLVQTMTIVAEELAYGSGNTNPGAQQDSNSGSEEISQSPFGTG